MRDDEKRDSDAPPPLEPPAATDGESVAASLPEEEDGRLFIVGVGASAGGLEALGTLLKQVTLDSAMAMVIVQHLAPRHESFLPVLLSRSSKLEVLKAEEGMKVEPGRVYVIPPNADLTLDQGVLHLTMPPADQHRPHLPVDSFFRSLAEDQGARAIGVVLSGTGSDGTFGLKAIKEKGGITFAQDPTTARYDGMPRSALEAGWADFCLAPEQIADELRNIGRHPYLARPNVPPSHTQEGVAQLLKMMRTAFGHDLTFYKSSTVDRRIERRMALQKIEKIDDYIKFVQGSADELRHLYKDMLISVTSFFRDHDPFEALKTKVLPKLLEGRETGSQIRVWVPACSTGEEAYSYAMCLLEFLDSRAQDFRIQIFGTDIDEGSIQHARRGVYPENIALDVSPERLHRFFVKKEGEYQVSRRIRDMVVFSAHSVTKDPPFSRIDIASCRNLLIYLQPAMQRKVLQILHYSLQPQGYLVLGTSETVGDAADLYSMVDRKNKLYAKKHMVAPQLADIGFGRDAQYVATPLAATLRRPAANVATIADRKILELYGPPGVVVSDDLEVLHFRGRTGPYLEPSPGVASLSILRLARPEIHVDLRRAIHEAQTDNTHVSVESKSNEGGRLRRVTIEVLPIVEPETKARCLLVLFQEHAPPPVAPALSAVPASPNGEGGGHGERAPAVAAAPDDGRLQELERDLLLTKEYLQSTIEELESANEELKSSNEEMQSSNEELQSTNEELETSKEELQSANEELTTVNDELQNRMGELQQANDDLHNVLTGVGNAVLIVGMDQRIRRYTHTAERLLNLVSTDLGRSVALINTFTIGLRVEALVVEVIDHLAPIDREVLCADDRWYALQVTPYKTLDHAIRGAVVVLVDIDVRKRTLQLGRDVAQYANDFLGVIPHPLMIVDKRLHAIWVNDAFYQRFQMAPAEALSQPLQRIGGGIWDNPRLLQQLEGTVATGAAFRDCSVRQQNVGPQGERIVRVSGSRIPAMAGQSVLILLAFEEVPRQLLPATVEPG